MQVHRVCREIFRQYSVVSFVVRAGVVAILGVLCAGLSASVAGAYGQPGNICPGDDQAYSTKSGDQWNSGVQNDISASRFVTSTNRANANDIYSRQVICAPRGSVRVQSHGTNPVQVSPLVRVQRSVVQKPSVGNTKPSTKPGAPPRNAGVVNKPTVTQTPRTVVGTGATGRGNIFPYGVCTWWADQRYYQTHGAYVPWTVNANAWQWSARASEFGWRVSSVPSVGSIIVLQSGVQGASGLGHVAYVEQVLSNGRVLTSNMNWGGSVGAVTYVQFAPGPGVLFISR